MGEHKINIASIDVGRIKIRQKAVMVLNVDSAVSDKVLQEITRIEGIFGATLVEL